MYLQLVDRGILSLNTDMRTVFPPLAKASSRLFTGLDEHGEPQYRDNDTPVTLLHMLNQSSGVGMEFGDKVQSWKKYTQQTGGKGGGFVNSCKVVSVPACQPADRHKERHKRAVPCRGRRTVSGSPTALTDHSWI